MTHLGAGIQNQPRRSGKTGPARQGGTVHMSFIPATLDRDGICAAQQVAIGADFLLNGALVSNGRANINPTGGFGRCVGVYSAADTSGDTVTVYGFDVDGEPLVETIAGPNNTTTAGLKAFAVITRVKANTAITDDMEIGTIDKFGLPCFLADLAEVVRIGWTQTLADNAATVAVGVTTSPATATTGDVRGTVIPSTAANGTRKLTAVLVQPSVADFYGRVRQYGAGIL